MGSGSGRGGSEERRALIDRGKVKAKDEESQNGRMGVWVLKTLMSVPHSILICSQVCKTTEVKEQMYQVDQVKTQHSAQIVSLKLF